MKKYINYIFALVAVLAVSCQTLDISNPSYLTDEEVTELLEGDNDNAEAMILTGVGNTLNTYFNISGQSWSGYSNIDRNSQAELRSIN